MYILPRIPGWIRYNINKRKLLRLIKKNQSIIISLCIIMSYKIITISIFIKINSKLLEILSFYSCRSISIILSFKIYLFFDKILCEYEWTNKFSNVIITCTKVFSFFIFVTFDNFYWKRIFIYHIYIRISKFIIFSNCSSIGAKYLV